MSLPPSKSSAEFLGDSSSSVHPGKGPIDLGPLTQRWLLEADQEAAQTLIESLYPQVLRIVQNHRPRGVDLEDLTQDVFVQFFKTLHRYDPQRPLENWVSRLALNVCLKALRQNRLNRQSAWSDLSEGEQATVESLLHTPQSSPRCALQPEEARSLLARLLETLSAQERMILTLLHLEEKSIAQIAEATGWNRILIKVRAFRARAKLRNALEKLDPRKT